MLEGFILIDKPSGPTSHDMVNFIRRLTGLRQVGHAGTLDPFATGLLILGIGKATKKLNTVLGLDKTYEATLRLGATTNTYDRTGIVTAGQEKNIDIKEIKNVLKKFTGQIEQVPPMYSAKKVAGKKLYELARQGIEIKREPVKITIFEIGILSYKYPTLILKIHCSSGTYIRSLAHDIGQILGAGAYLEELRRSSIGNFKIEDAADPNKLTKENINSFIIN